MRNNRLLWTLVLVLSLIAFAHASFGLTPTPTPDLVRRQGDKNSESAKKTSNGDSTNGTDEPTTTAKDEESASITSKATDGTKATDGSEASTGKATGSKTKPKSTRIPFNSPAGTVVLKTPSPLDGMQYYPLGRKPITFGWNMTGVLVTPTALNIEAYCPANLKYYTIAANYSSQETMVTWDTEKVLATATDPPPAETYTLYIYDASIARTAPADPGHLAPFSGLRFALYKPQDYTPYSQWKCDICNDSSILSSRELRVFLGTAFIFAVSVAWFIAGVAH